MGFIKPMVILGIASSLLILEPDFGAAAILLLTGLGLMFLGGVRFGQFMLFVLGTLAIMVVLAMSSPYRLARITSFNRARTAGYERPISFSTHLIFPSHRRNVSTKFSWAGER